MTMFVGNEEKEMDALIESCLWRRVRVNTKIWYKQLLFSYGFTSLIRCAGRWPEGVRALRTCPQIIVFTSSLVLGLKYIVEHEKDDFREANQRFHWKYEKLEIEMDDLVEIKLKCGVHEMYDQLAMHAIDNMNDIFKSRRFFLRMF